MVRLLDRKTALISKLDRYRGHSGEGFSNEISSPRVAVSLEQVKRLKPSQIQAAVDSYRAGASVRAIASEIEVARQTISKLLSERNVERRVGALTDDQLQQLKVARQQGLTLQQLADQFEVSLSTMKRRTRELRRDSQR